jgi:hypothetical protein
LRSTLAAPSLLPGGIHYILDLVMTAKIEIETSAAVHTEDNSSPARQTWIKPGYQKFLVRGSETANTNSNFDGTNYSS